jgi:hypothetical protein
MRRSALVAGALVATALSLGFRGAADETISWSVRPLVVRWDELVNASGAIGSGQAGQLVTIQLRACDQQTWLDVAEATTRGNGSWSVDFLTRISGLLRATSGGATTDSVQFQQRPYVFFSQRRPGRFRAGVQAQRQYWHRRMRVDRFVKSRGAWVTVKRVLITKTEGDGGGGMSDIASTTDVFRVDVPKGTNLRAVLPTEVGRPCYIAGFSPIVIRR